MTVLDNVKEMRAWVAGAIAFDATVTGLLVAVFSVDPVKTTIATSATTIVALAIIWLIYRSENRTHASLHQHIQESNKLREELKICMVDNRKALQEIRKDTLRIQLSQYIKDQPDNIDTILKIAEEYFVNLHGDWYMTSEFKKWAKAHEIEVPQIITTAMIANEK